MKTKDIIVGQQYGHRDYPYARYLGIQDKRQQPRKSMVIITAPDKTAGFTVFSPERAGSTFWDGFYPIDNP